MAAQSVQFGCKINNVFKQINNHKIEFEWILHAKLTEDEGGVSLTAYHEMGLVNPNVYYAITDCLYYSADDLILQVNDDEWHNTNVGWDDSLPLFSPDTLSTRIMPRDALTDIIYLGQPRNAASGQFGRITVYVSDNTGTNEHRIMIRGIAFKDELPTTTIYRPNPCLHANLLK